MKKLGLAASVALGFLGLGFIFIALAWNGAAGKDSIQEQFPYVISGAIAGLGFIGVGIGLLLFEAGRRLSASLNEKVEALAAMMGAPAVHANGAPTIEAQKALETASSNGRVVVGRSSFHRPDCRLVSSKTDNTFASTDEALARGLQPCRVCAPAAAATN